MCDRWNCYRTCSLQKSTSARTVLFSLLVLPLHKYVRFPDSAIFSDRHISLHHRTGSYKCCIMDLHIFSAPVPVLLQFLPYNITYSLSHFFLLQSYDSFQCSLCNSPSLCMLSNPCCLSASYNTITTELDRFRERISGSIGIRMQAGAGSHTGSSNISGVCRDLRLV